MAKTNQPGFLEGEQEVRAKRAVGKAATARIDIGALQNELIQSSLRRDHVYARFNAEVQFAEALCQMHPQRASAWRKLLAQAISLDSPQPLWLMPRNSWRRSEKQPSNIPCIVWVTHISI